MKPQICIITLCVEDLEKSFIFYTKGLGMEGVVTRGENHITISPEDSLPISLFTQNEFEKFAGASGGGYNARTCISHAAVSKEEVDGILEKAKNAGGLLINTPKEYEWGYSGYFKDLDGHLWEVVYFQE